MSEAILWICVVFWFGVAPAPFCVSFAVFSAGHSERTQLLQKFARNYETTKGRKDGTNIHLNWGGPLLGVQKANVFGSENEIAAVTFLQKMAHASFNKSNTLPSATEWQDSGEHGC